VGKGFGHIPFPGGWVSWIAVTHQNDLQVPGLKQGHDPAQGVGRQQRAGFGQAKAPDQVLSLGQIHNLPVR